MQFVKMEHERELPPIIEDTDALRHISELKRELANKGISEMELSLRAKINPRNLKLYVNNKALPGLTDYNRIACVLGWKIVKSYKKGGEA